MKINLKKKKIALEAEKKDTENEINDLKSNKDLTDEQKNVLKKKLEDKRLILPQTRGKSPATTCSHRKHKKKTKLLRKTILTN